jgi:hypothetical protein
METASLAGRCVSGSPLYCVASVVYFQRRRACKTIPDRTHWGPGICSGTLNPGVIYNRACDDVKRQVKSGLQRQDRLNPTQLWDFIRDPTQA